MGKIECILFDAHISYKGRCRYAKRDLSHSIILDDLRGVRPPNKSVWVTIPFHKFNSFIHLADVSSDGDSVHCKKSGVNTRLFYGVKRLCIFDPKVQCQTSTPLIGVNIDTN